MVVSELSGLAIILGSPQAAQSQPVSPFGPGVVVNRSLASSIPIRKRDQERRAPIFVGCSVDERFHHLGQKQ